MSRKRKELSQEEIWDDSALQNSWEEALEEYKLYHSIHAKGERVEDVLEAFESTDHQHYNEVDGEEVNSKADDQAVAGQDEDVEDGEWQDDGATSNEVQQKAGDPLPLGTGTQFPDQIVNGVNDDGLKNLMMSWYWAGYYTGFYQGQSQAKVHAGGRGGGNG